MARISELPPRKRLVAIGAIAASVALVTVAERDLQRRPNDQVRGNKLLWRIVSLNALGAVSYLKWGRRPPTPQAAPAVG